jgi:hypothetical protein
MEREEIDISGKELDLLHNGNILDKKEITKEDLTEWTLEKMNEMLYDKSFLEILNNNSIKLNFSQNIEVEKKREIIEKFLFTDIFFSNRIKIGDLDLTEHLENHLNIKKLEIEENKIIEEDDIEVIVEEEAAPKKLTVGDLNEDQRFIYDALINNLTKVGVCSIAGSAGVGKSTLISFVIKAIYEKGYSICCVAPSHQALNVLKEMLAEQLSYFQLQDITFKTLASYLCMEHDIDENGNEIFKKSKDPKKLEKEVRADFVLVDESSMVNKEHSMELMNNIGRTIFKQLIYLGDSFQVKPVTGEPNPIYDPYFRREEGPINKFFLNKVTRQAEGNPIIELAQYIRMLIEEPMMFNEREFFQKLLYFTDDPESGIRYVDSWEEFMAHYLYNDVEDDPKLQKKVIASYTNKKVEADNNYIRFALNYKEYNVQHYLQLPPYIVGETFVFLKPYKIGQDIAYQISEQITINEITERTLKGETEEDDLRYFKLSTDDIPVNVLHPEDLPIYYRVLNKLKDTANNTPSIDTKLRRSNWGKYYDFMYKFAQLRPAYSNTIHKLQGSTYRTCYLNLPEIRQYLYKDLDAVLRLIYVGITRGKKLVLLRG